MSRVTSEHTPRRGRWETTTASAGYKFAPPAARAMMAALGLAALLSGCSASGDDAYGDSAAPSADMTTTTNFDLPSLS